MKKSLLITCFALLSSLATAAPNLNKELAKQYFDAIKNLELVQKQYPEIEKSFDSALIDNRAKFIETVKHLAQFPAIEKATTTSGFTNFEEFYDIGMRVMGGMMAVQMEQMPEGMGIEDMFSAQEMAIDRMKAANLPQEQLDAMMEQLQEQKLGMQSMLKLAESASPEDITFARENISWIMTNMPEDDTQDNMNE
jgi:acyl-[acyl carrier protein]--UDP-N-acetylglucosamine O-acyltransferase